MDEISLIRDRIVSDIAHARTVVIPGMVTEMLRVRLAAPDYPEHDRMAMFVTEIQRQAGKLEMAIVLAVLIENAVDRLKAS